MFNSKSKYEILAENYDLLCEDKLEQPEDEHLPFWKRIQKKAFLLEDSAEIVGRLFIGGLMLIVGLSSAMGILAEVNKKLYDQIIDTVSAYMEGIYGQVFASVWYDEKKKQIMIEGIAYDKLLLRLEELYREANIKKIFERKYTLTSLILKDVGFTIREKDMEISRFVAHSFFAMELAEIFLGLYDKYHFSYYHKIASQLIRTTWLRYTFDTKTVIPMDMSGLSNIKYILKDFQLEFVKNYKTLKYRNRLNGYILSFEQGLGKTLTSVALVECLKKEKIYIICPNSIKENWSNEIKQYYKKYENNPELYFSEVFILENPKYHYDKEKTRFFIVNNESISKLMPYLDPRADSMIIVDESHNFRNLGGKRVAEMLEVRDKLNCKDCLMMSGTPIKATPNEIIPALMMIDETFDWNAATLYNKVFKIDDIYSAEIVRKRFSGVIYRKTKKETLDLPAKKLLSLTYSLDKFEPYLLENVNLVVREHFDVIYAKKLEENIKLRDRYVELIEKYSKSSFIAKQSYYKWVYNKNTDKKMTINEFSKEWYEGYANKYVIPFITDPNEKKEFNTLTKQFISMKKSAMGLALGEIVPKMRTEMYSNLFIENVDMILNMIQKNDKKTVIFSTMLGVIKTMEEVLQKRKIGYVKIVGETKDRMDIITRFKNNDNINILIATSQTLSTGVTLVEANQMFFFGPPWRSADFDQACDRIHRIGQTSECRIYNCLLGTMEPNLSTRMDEILKWSGKMFSGIIDEKETDLQRLYSDY